MASINKTFLLGNLGRDPDLRRTSAGTPVLSFPMATSRRWKDRKSGDLRSSTDWHRIVVWGTQAEVLREHLKKGSQVHVEGRLQSRAWTDGNDDKRYVTEVVATRVQMLGRPEDRKAPAPVEAPDVPAEAPEPAGADDEDISF